MSGLLNVFLPQNKLECLALGNVFVRKAGTYIKSVPYGATTLSITTFSVTTFSILDLIATLSITGPSLMLF